MTEYQGKNPEGLQPRQTYEELLNTPTFNLNHPDRTYTSVRNYPCQSQFDQIGMFELGDTHRRQTMHTTQQSGYDEKYNN